MSAEESVSRRRWLQVTGGTIVGLAVGAAAGYLGAPKAPAEVVTKTVEKTTTVTVTPPPITPKPTPEKIMVAGMTDCVRDDRSWGQVHYESMERLTEKYPNVEISYAESVPWADIEKLYRDYAEEGYQVVGWWGFQGAEPCLAVAPTYVNTQFYFTCVTQHAPNAISMVYLEEEEGFLSGILAGLLTKTNTVGVYIGTDSPCGNAYANAYEIGAKLMNPDVTCLKAYAGSWVDPAKGKETALALFDAGADFLGKYSAISDIGGFEACKERNVYTTGIYLDQSAFAPDQVLASFTFHPDVLLEKMVKNTLEGYPPVGGQWPCGFAPMFYAYKRVQRHPAFDKLPSDVQEKFNHFASEIETGHFVPVRDESRFAVAI